MKRFTLLAILLSAFGLRVWLLGGQELRGDEAFGYFFSQMGFEEIIKQTLALQEPHPVASYFLQKIWLSWAGHSEFALRFLSAWFGVAAVALVYRLGAALRLGNVRAQAAAALMAVSPYGVWHGQDARMYSMSLALTVCSTWLALEWINSAWTTDQLRRRLVGAGYLLISWLALQTHYFALFVIVAQNLFALISTAQVSLVQTAGGGALAQKQPPYLQRILPWLALQIALGLLYLPWLLQVRMILGGYVGNGDSPAFLNMLTRSVTTFAVGESLAAPESWLFAAAAGLLLLMGSARLARGGDTGKRAALLLLLYLLAPLLATWVGSLQRPIFNERYLVSSAPPFYLLVAAALPNVAVPLTKFLSIKSSLFVMWFLLVVSGGMGLSLYNHYTNPNFSKTIGWRELSATLERMAAGLPVDDVRMVENFPDPTLWYYYEGPVEHLVLPPAQHDADGANREVAALGRTGRVVLVVQPADNWDDRSIAQSALSTRYRLLAETKAGAWPVQIYTLPPQNLPPSNQPFQNGVVLAGVAQAPTTIVPGGLLAVHLGWNLGAATLTGSEKVFVHLVGPDGQLVAQNDRPLLVNSATEFVSSYGILVPADAPAGEYRLLVGLYDPNLDGAPRVLTNEGADAVEIGVMRTGE
ncbi:MAG: glycosyltransferase family 39 protein [Caldilineaceae bacterium]